MKRQKKYSVSLCILSLFALMALLPIKPALADNTSFYGAFYHTSTTGSCPTQSKIAIIGGDYNKISQSNYYYIPASGENISYSYIDSYGDLNKITITISGLSIIILNEKSWDPSNPDDINGTENYAVIFYSDYSGYTFTGNVTSDDPTVCQGYAYGNGTRAATGAEDVDLNHDGEVTIDDLVIAAQCNGQDPSSNLDCSEADIDGDGDIDEDDLALISIYFNCIRPIIPTISISNSNVNSGETYTVSWNTIDNAAQYILEEATNPDFLEANRYFLPSSQTSKQINNMVTSTTTYYYHVAAYNESCQWSSEYSNQVDIVVISSQQEGDQFINEVRRTLEQLTSKTIFGGYSEDKIKHLLFFKFGLPDSIPWNAKISILFDLDDLAGITAEGQAGWITFWLDFEFGVAVGTNPFPVGAGFVGIKREVNVDDPWRTGRVADLTTVVLGKTFTGITVTEHGIQEGSLLLSSATTDFAFFTLLSTTWNLLRGEISRYVLLNNIKESFSETGLITSFLPIGRSLFNSMFAFDQHQQIVKSGTESIWRSFTSSDAPVETGNRLSIRRVYGGIDLDSDGRQDNYVPPSLAKTGKPSVYYPLKLDFFSDDLQEMNLKVVVSNVPEGWVIESIADNGEPPLFNKNTYPVDNATPWTLYRTEWHIGCLRSAKKEVSVDFSLYENKLIGDALIDTVHVKFRFPVTKAMPWMPLLLLDDQI